MKIPAFGSANNIKATKLVSFEGRSRKKMTRNQISDEMIKTIEQLCEANSKTEVKRSSKKFERLSELFAKKTKQWLDSLSPEKREKVIIALKQVSDEVAKEFEAIANNDAIKPQPPEIPLYKRVLSKL